MLYRSQERLIAMNRQVNPFKDLSIGTKFYPYRILYNVWKYVNQLASGKQDTLAISNRTKIILIYRQNLGIKYILLSYVIFF